MLCNTGAKIGTSETWNARIETVNSEGIDAIADAILERWFAPNWRRANPVALAGWRQMLARTSTEGYAGTCAAIRDADLMQSSRKLTVPTVCVAGSADGATPPDVVKALADIMPNAKYHCIDDTGHLPCIEAPDALSNILIQHYDALA
jgi:pimeloyl-ACP methyl ester carboxylesterase